MSHKLRGESRKNQKKTRLYHWIVVSFSFPFLIGFITAFEIVRFSKKHDLEKADAAIVLGARVKKDRPYPVFEARLMHAVELYKKGQVGSILLTGGRCENDAEIETLVARQFLLQNQIPESAIYSESTSQSTFENLVEAQKIVREKGFNRVLIVSDGLHLKRAVKMAKDLGMSAYPAPVSNSAYKSNKSKFFLLMKESAAYLAYLFFRPSFFLRHFLKPN